MTIPDSMMTSDHRELTEETKEFLTEYPEVREDFLTFLRYMAKQFTIGNNDVVVGDVINDTNIGLYHISLIVDFLKDTGSMSNSPENPEGQTGEIEWVKA